MVMGIVICMAKRVCANIRSVPTTSNTTASVSKMAIKRKNAVTTMHQNVIRNGVCISHGAKCYCTIPACGKPLFQAQKCRSHFLCLLLAQAEFDLTREDVLTAAKAMVGMRHDASAMTSGSVVG